MTHAQPAAYRGRTLQASYESSQTVHEEGEISCDLICVKWKSGHKRFLLHTYRVKREASFSQNIRDGS
jgi:hypothetical protein